MGNQCIAREKSKSRSCSEILIKAKSSWTPTTFDIHEWQNRGDKGDSMTMKVTRTGLTFEELAAATKEQLLEAHDLQPGDIVPYAAFKNVERNSKERGCNNKLFELPPSLSSAPLTFELARVEGDDIRSYSYGLIACQTGRPEPN